MGYGVDEMVLEKAFLRALRVSLVSITPQMLECHILVQML